MAMSRRSAVAVAGVTVGASTLVALLMMPALAGGAPAPAPAAQALAGACSATAHVDNQWYGGEIVTVKVTNTSTAAATRWAVTWTLAAGQSVVSAWNATVTTTGATATAVNASYNGALAPGASTTFGMQLSGVPSTPMPSCANDGAPPSGADVTVTQADSMRTVTLYVGQTLGVSLGREYIPPTIGAPVLTQVSASGGYPTGQPFTGLYRAAAPGSVDITTHSDDPCLHATPPCAIPVALWTVHVTVIDVPSTGQTVTVSTPDNQRALGLHVGDVLVVRLASEYQPPKLSTAGVLVPLDVVGGYPANQPLVARYTATTAGQTDVSTVTDNPCFHLPTPCPSPQTPWTVHVTVTP